VSDPRGIPSLDELDPAKAAELPVEIVKQLVVKHITVVQLLLARLISGSTTDAKPNGDSELIIGTAGFAAMIGRSKSWVEHHLDDLPPRRSLLGEPVWLKRDVERWIRGLPDYGKG